MFILVNFVYWVSVLVDLFVVLDDCVILVIIFIVVVIGFDIVD